MMAIDLDYFDQKSQQIKIEASEILVKWGLLPRFKRWRLSKDPDTGMIVLFGVLNKRYIEDFTSNPFSDYFDPHVLVDLAHEMKVQVVPSDIDDFHYGFILSRGQIDALPPKERFRFMG